MNPARSLFTALSDLLQRMLPGRKFERVHLPADPVEIEVLFDGIPTAVLTDRLVIETFWRSYQITPLRPELKSVIEDVASWNTRKVIFRDRRSGKTCTTWCGGLSHYVKDGRISLRDLYFT